MEPEAQPETTESEGPPICDACREYECKLMLPGEFAGAYFEYLTSGGEEKDGTLCILHFGDPNKDAEKCARAVEDKIRNKDFNFEGVLFSCPVTFHGEMENANFGGATFSGDAYFGEAAFSGVAYFGQTTFSGAANFVGAKFSGEAGFRVATFSGAADFGWATFSGDADFLGATFSGAANFWRATFKEAALFGSLAKSRDDKRNPIDRRVLLDFPGVTLGKPDKIHFRDVNMAKVSFLDTDVRKVEFTNIQWPERLRDEREAAQGRKWFPRAMLRNWRELREAWRQATKRRKDRLAAVEKLCHQLRQNYEDQRNYPDAGRFYHGEMEMRRKSNPWRRYLPSLTTLYWLSSGYGQRPWRAFFWTVALLILFSLGYMAAELRMEGVSDHSFPATVGWSDLTANWTSLREWGRNFGYAALHTLQVLIFSRNRTFTPVDWQGELLIVLQTILLPLQVALLALAVRRRFQR